MGRNASSAFVDSRDGRLDMQERGIIDASGDVLARVARPIVPIRLVAPYDPKNAAPGEPEYDRRLPHAIANPGDYGDMAFNTVTFLAAGEQLALERPSGFRVYLLIQNQLPNLTTNNINVAFGQPATPIAAGVSNGLQIPPGGNFLMDTRVAQNDVSIFAPAAGSVLVAYINADLFAPQR